MNSQQFIKELAFFNGFCASPDEECKECPFYINGECTERETMNERPDAYEQKVHGFYVSRHKTRYEVVQELFPDMVFNLSCSALEVPCPDNGVCDTCPYHNWWDKPYKQ